MVELLLEVIGDNEEEEDVLWVVVVRMNQQDAWHRMILLHLAVAVGLERLLVGDTMLSLC
jgi:hypothetical protein